MKSKTKTKDIVKFKINNLHKKSKSNKKQRLKIK